MNYKAVLVALATMAMGLTSYAQTSTNAGETKTKVQKQNKVEGDLDNEITNAKLRAESGSKSKFSSSISATYSGGSISDPGSKDRKNLLGGSNVEQVRFSGRVSGRYRFTKNTSMTAGIGMNIVQPFHSAQEELGQNDYGDKTEVSNPNVAVSHYRRVNNWMLQAGGGVTVITAEKTRLAGYQANPYLTGTALYDFKNGFNVGMLLAVDTLVLNRNASRANPDFEFGWHPFVEYAFNDTFNFRTIWNFGVAHSSGEVPGQNRWTNTGMRQSFGLGIAATRDIFLYPNFQIPTRNFYADFESDRTTVGISATINVF